MNTVLGYEMIKRSQGDIDFLMNSDGHSEKIVQIFSSLLIDTFKSKSVEQLSDSKLFEFELENHFRFKNYCWSPNVSIGILTLT